MPGCSAPLGRFGPVERRGFGGSMSPSGCRPSTFCLLVSWRNSSIPTPAFCHFAVAMTVGTPEFCSRESANASPLIRTGLVPTNCTIVTVTSIAERFTASTDFSDGAGLTSIKSSSPCHPSLKRALTTVTLVPVGVCKNRDLISSGYSRMQP